MWRQEGVVINADKVNQRAYAIVFVVTEHINPNLYGPSGELGGDAVLRLSNSLCKRGLKPKAGLVFLATCTHS